MSVFVHIICLFVLLFSSLDALPRLSHRQHRGSFTGQRSTQSTQQPIIREPIVRETRVVRETREENDFTGLRRLEIKAGEALVSGQENRDCLQELERLNKYYFDQLWESLGSCDVKTREALLKLYNYGLSFPEIKRAIYPFRSTISHLSYSILQQASKKVLKEKIEDFSSVYIALKLAFENIQEKLASFLNDNFINSFKNDLLNIFIEPTNGISYVKPNSFFPQEPVFLPGPYREPFFDEQQQQNSQENARRSFVSGKLKWLLAAIGLCGIGWLGKRYVVDPVRRYRNLADIAEKFLKRVEGLPVNQIIQESVKATAELPEEQQKQFFDLVLAAMQQKGLIEKKEAIKLIFEEVAQLPEQQQKQLLATVKEVFGNDFLGGESIDDKKEIFKTFIDLVGALPQDQQEQMFRTLAQVFKLDCDETVFAGMNVGQIRNDVQRFLVWQDRFNRARNRVNGVKERIVGGGTNLLRRGRNLVGGFFRTAPVVVEETEEKKSESELVKKDDDVQEVTNGGDTNKKIETSEIIIDEIDDGEMTDDGEESDDEEFKDAEEGITPKKEVERSFLDRWVIDPVKKFVWGAPNKS